MTVVFLAASYNYCLFLDIDLTLKIFIVTDNNIKEG